jgi:DNA primase
LADEIEEIRSRINIVDLVSQRVQLKKAGKDFEGLCPFHDDKRPSFRVNPILGRYKCWSCGEQGDIFNWVMKTQSLEFVDALELLAKQAGVTLSRKKVSAQEKSEKALHLEIMESAQGFFADHVNKSHTALEYLKSRGIEEAVVKDWEIGFAPEVGEALAVFLQKKGYSLSTCRTLFLVEEDASGGYYDKFRGRLMFPIRNEQSELVGFGGRALGDAQPKYINSSDTPLYRKGRVLYGMHKAGSAIARSKPRRAVLCEGYLDVIACHRSDVKGAVASLGTALSEDHARMLARWADEVVILYDADSAGQKATERALEVLRPFKIDVRVALMPQGEDPDTLLRNSGPGAVLEAVKNSKLPVDFKVDQIVSRYPEKNQGFWNEIVGALAEAKYAAEMERHIESLVSQYTGVSDQLHMREELRKQVLSGMRRKKKDQTSASSVAATVVMSVQSLQPAEATLIAALPTPGLRTIAHDALVLPELQVSEAGRSFAQGYTETFGSEAPNGEASVWVGKLPEPLRDLVLQCSGDARFSNLSDRFVKDAINHLLRQLERRKLQLIKQGEREDRITQIEATLKAIKAR